MGAGGTAALTVLVVDDEQSYADMTEEWLIQEGMDIVVATSAEEALGLLETGFDCIVSDYDMPGMDGLAFLAATREQGFDVPFVMHTGHGNEALASEAIAAGVTDYVPKGFSQAHFATLAARIRLAVERVRAERRFHAVFTQGFDAMLIADDEGRYIDGNPAAERIMGLPHEELLGRRVSEFTEGGFDLETEWATFLERGEQTGEFTIVRPDGERRTLEFDAVANIIPGEHLTVIRDVTDRRRAEATVKAQHDRLAAISTLTREDLRARVTALETTLTDIDIGYNGNIEALLAELEALDERLDALDALASDPNPEDEPTSDGETGAAG